MGVFKENEFIYLFIYKVLCNKIIKGIINVVMWL